MMYEFYYGHIMIDIICVLQFIATIHNSLTQMILGMHIKLYALDKYVFRFYTK